MEKIARHVERIREIPESALPPVEESPATPFREDHPVAADGYAELTANSSGLSHRHVAVPRVVE
jgi:Asp-tRNA(Asn)/Glu-tRNA(Gln) amidotransferase C subunit